MVSEGKALLALVIAIIVFFSFAFFFTVMHSRGEANQRRGFAELCEEVISKQLSLSILEAYDERGISVPLIMDEGDTSRAEVLNRTRSEYSEAITKCSANIDHIAERILHDELLLLHVKFDSLAADFEQSKSTITWRSEPQADLIKSINLVRIGERYLVQSEAL